MNQEKIGKFIAALRKENNLTQEELASKLGLTKNAVSNWERGISLMDMSLLNPLCEILGVSITELLNGERIKKEEIQEKSDEIIKNTFDYTNKEIKKNRIRNILCTILVIIVIIGVTFFSYKLYLLNKYTYKLEDNNVSEVINGLKNSKEIKIYKRTLADEEYLVLDNFKIRNDFLDYTKDDNNDIYRIEKDGKKYGISFFPRENNPQLIDSFVTDISNTGDNITDKFNKADRKYFLLKNDINDDIDFYKYVTNNYYKENNIFMDKRTMMENYAFNVFVNTSITEVEKIIYISGDYEGMIFKIDVDGKKNTTIQIIKDGKVYGFVANDERFDNEEYLIDLLGTVEIR